MEKGTTPMLAPSSANWIDFGGALCSPSIRPAASISYPGHSPPLGQTLYYPQSRFPKSKYLLSLGEKKKESPFSIGVWELLLRFART